MEIADRVQTALTRPKRPDISLVFPTPSLTVAPYLSSDLPASLTPQAGRLGCHGRSSVRPAVRHQRPDDPRHFVGQRHGHQHARLAREHAGEPGAGPSVVTRGDFDRRAGAEDEQPPETALAHLRGAAEPLLA